MKNILFFLSFILFISCEDPKEKFSGSPVGNQSIETITGVLTVTESFALPGQEVAVKVEIPSTFRVITNDTLEVQASSFSQGGGIRNSKVIVLPDQTSGTAKLQIPGGDGTFDLTADLKITGINFRNKIKGKHFLINSNVVTIQSGNSSIPSTKDNQLKINIDWENITAKNKLRVKVERLKTTSVTIVGTNGSGRITVAGIVYNINFRDNLTTTAQDFVLANQANILSTSNITVRSNNSDLLFDASSDIAPIVSIVKFPVGVANTFNGSVYREVNVGAANDIPKTYSISQSKLGSTSEFPLGSVVSGYAYNEGTYRVKIGVNTATDLITSPTNLKFRIVLRYPNGKVETYRGTYNGLTAVSGFKSVLDIKKTGFGENTVFTPSNFISNP